MQSLQLSKLESFYVGGEPRPHGHRLRGPQNFMQGAMYVQHMAPVTMAPGLPVVFVHGGCHTGVTWETTPDGREGWASLFVRAGFPVYIVDQAWRGRSAPDLLALDSGVDPSPSLPEVWSASLEALDLFIRGGDRFPLDHLEQYAAQLWPDFGVAAALAAGQPGLSDARALPPMLALLDRIGPAILVAHSQAGDLAWKTALARPDQVAAVVAVEPGVTSPGLDDPNFPDIPVYVMWADNLLPDGPVLSQRELAAARAIAARRSKVTVDHLPEHGVHGNGHMLMMEDNSAELAGRVISWLDAVLTH